jgi:hypothetical protein
VQPDEFQPDGGTVFTGDFKNQEGSKQTDQTKKHCKRVGAASARKDSKETGQAQFSLRKAVKSRGRPRGSGVKKNMKSSVVDNLVREHFEKAKSSSFPTQSSCSPDVPDIPASDAPASLSHAQNAAIPQTLSVEIGTGATGVAFMQEDIDALDGQLMLGRDFVDRVSVLLRRAALGTHWTGFLETLDITNTQSIMGFKRTHEDFATILFSGRDHGHDHHLDSKQ